MSLLGKRIHTAARARDLDTVDGLEMLVGQAAIAFAILFGAEPPRDRDEERAKARERWRQRDARGAATA